MKFTRFLTRVKSVVEHASKYSNASGKNPELKDYLRFCLVACLEASVATMVRQLDSYFSFILLRPTETSKRLTCVKYLMIHGPKNS